MPAEGALMCRTLTRALPLVVAMYAVVACGADGMESGGLSGSAHTGGSEPVAGQTITLVTNDTFAISEGTLEAFTAEDGPRVRFGNGIEEE